MIHANTCKQKGFEIDRSTQLLCPPLSELLSSVFPFLGSYFFFQRVEYLSDIVDFV